VSSKPLSSHWTPFPSFSLSPLFWHLRVLVDASFFPLTATPCRKQGKQSSSDTPFSSPLEFWSLTLHPYPFFYTFLSPSTRNEWVLSFPFPLDYQGIFSHLPLYSSLFWIVLFCVERVSYQREFVHFSSFLPSSGPPFFNCPYVLLVFTLIPSKGRPLVPAFEIHPLRVRSVHEDFAFCESAHISFHLTAITLSPRCYSFFFLKHYLAPKVRCFVFLLAPRKDPTVPPFLFFSFPLFFCSANELIML